MKEIFAFVYRRGDMIKVLSHDESLLHHKDLLNDKWLHIATLDAISYLNSILNNNIKLADEL